MPLIPYEPTREQRLRAIKDVVHDYANFVAAGHYSFYGDAPWRGACDDSFLLGCRKIGDFLIDKKRPTNHEGTKELDSILAKDYLDPNRITWKLPVWSREWRNTMNRQLAHLAYKRDKEWDHTKWIPILIPEFRMAWNAFQTAITDREYCRVFGEHIESKKHLIELPDPPPSPIPPRPLYKWQCTRL